MVVKIKEFFEKSRQLKNTSYEDKEMQDIMKKYYQIKRNKMSYFFYYKNGAVNTKQRFKQIIFYYIL